MKSRYNYDPAAYDAMDAVDQYLDRCGLEPLLLHLVRLRASQLNGCAYCIDMHWKDLRALSENEQRLYGLDAWREAPYYNDRERAALAWTEAVTKLEGHVPDALFGDVRAAFTDKELSNLTLAISQINAWNRLSIASRLVPGKYQPAKLEVAQ